ncbi:hypothetical protein HPB48_025891 [Haemaphysalis longicornis]|uniref:Uncharacterized protein n=1 Tax=Haemaphysalis longicornis TaxID=44386 RepID=A0A9J6H8C9_HAELO|nr:hypothetical protein HPB48_025891 [Haemaphysalis longicornis]
MSLTHTVILLEHSVFARYRPPPRFQSRFIIRRFEERILRVTRLVAAVAEKHKALHHRATA